MKTYEYDTQSPDGWNVTATLELTEDRQFGYSEGWTDYTNASLSCGARGTWRRNRAGIVFYAEWVEGPMYFPWEVGKLLTAVEQDGALKFPQGWTFSPPSEFIVKTPVRNTGTKSLTLVLEPWGIRHGLAPGESVRVVAQGRWWEGYPQVAYSGDEIVFNGRNGSWATVVPEPPLPPPPTPPQPPKPPAQPRVPDAKAAKPDDKPPVTTTIKPPTAPSPTRAPAAAQFEPRAPSPELAALIRQWIDGLPTEGMENWIGRLCKENDAIPLDCTRFDLWVLQPDGQVMCIDHDSFARRAEPETNAEVAYGKLALGAEIHPELWELLPPERRGERRSE
jgi:hypothetical protein